MDEREIRKKGGAMVSERAAWTAGERECSGGDAGIQMISK
jgi:hypothetical protein